MQSLLAIARLTFKAAFRFRLVPLLGLFLIGGVAVLPAVIIHDGSARGLTQIVLTYTLGLITAVLGLATLWLACGTLARDIEECQIQMVAVKPVPRWKIWAGKWLGIMFVNLLLLGLSTAIVYGQLLWRAKSLSENQRIILQNEVFIARGSLRPPVPDYESEVQRRAQERLKNERVAAMDRAEVVRIIRDQVRAELSAVPPGWMRRWDIDMSHLKEQVRDQFMFLRIKFLTPIPEDTKTYIGLWRIGPAGSPRQMVQELSQAANTFHEIPLNPNLLDEQGKLTIEYANGSDSVLYFPLEEGIEVLYREGGFALNYVRGVTIIFCWLALLAAVGLFAASFLAFPVAAFFSLALLLVSFSTGTMTQVIEQGTIRAVDHETGQVGKANWFDEVTVLFFKGMYWTVQQVRDFSPIESLSLGRSITWGTLARAVAQVVLLMGGLFAVFGIWIFERRELAGEQGKA
ncbi:MAG: hypothetical protein IPM17_12045 [Verrucomicrobia bacterium]|nr:hypothetical protein [Verrucomicrobiota bacterium]